MTDKIFEKFIPIYEVVLNGKNTILCTEDFELAARRTLFAEDQLREDGNHSVTLRVLGGTVYRSSIRKGSEQSRSVESGISNSIPQAVTRYLRSAERFNVASTEFTAACKDLRKQLGPDRRFTIQTDGKQYLVTTDRDGNFDVDPIESF